MFLGLRLLRFCSGLGPLGFTVMSESGFHSRTLYRLCSVEGFHVSGYHFLGGAESFRGAAATARSEFSVMF